MDGGRARLSHSQIPRLPFVPLNETLCRLMWSKPKEALASTILSTEVSLCLLGGCTLSRCGLVYIGKKLLNLLPKIGDEEDEGTAEFEVQKH